MEFQHADNTSVALFCLLSLGMAFVCFRTIALAGNWKKWSVIYVIIISLFSIVAGSGIIVRNFFPIGPLLFALIFLFGMIFSFSKSGGEATKFLTLAALIGFQGFRLPLEIILHHWSTIGTIPETMTWSGQNWDIATGVLSVISIPFVSRSKSAALIVNSIGFLLLLNVIRVVVMSSPLPFAWELSNPLRLVSYFPYCLVGPLFVLPALVAHLLTYRKILVHGG